MVIKKIEVVRARYWWAKRIIGLRSSVCKKYANTKIKIIKQIMIVRLKWDDLDLKFRISFEKTIKIFTLRAI